MGATEDVLGELKRTNQHILFTLQSVLVNLAKRSKRPILPLHLSLKSPHTVLYEDVDENLELEENFEEPLCGPEPNAFLLQGEITIMLRADNDNAFPTNPYPQTQTQPTNPQLIATNPSA